MKKAAFLSFDWDYEITSEFYRGAEYYLFAHDDLQVTIFNAYGQYANYQPEEGALEVFSLCDPAAYDGFIIQGNRTWSPALRQKLVDEIVALGKPVVSINYKLEGAHYVGTDNYKAMYGLVDKVIAEKGCARTAFVNGLATSVEAQARLAAYVDVCEARGIKSSRFYQASWEMESGVEAAHKMLEYPDDLPDVVFCCNDDLAVGVQETLQARGVRVPQDVMICGFDNRDISLKAVPRITTVDRDYFTIGRTAVATLDGLMAGEERPQETVSPVRYVLSESAGFAGEEETRGEIAESLYSMDAALKSFYQVLMRFQPAILNADTLSEILLECETYFPEVRCLNTYLWISDNYLAHDVTSQVRKYGETAVLMAHSGDELDISCDYKHRYASFPTKEILPTAVPHDEPLYMVFPLRHNATCIGALVTEGVSPLLGYGFLTIALALLSASIESVRKKEILQSVNSKLDDLYVHDQLTGLFNRFGLERFGKIVYEHLLRDFEEAQFIFVDVDNMKVINDTCGHEVGDQALVDTADIIRGAIKHENAFAMRYGGDEFLIISRRNLIGKLEHEQALLKEHSVRPYELSLSMGACRVLESEGCTIDEAIQRADALMYEIKKAHKVGRI